MGLLRFVHDIIGYRAKWRKRHALLHVIEQHMFTFPDEWKEERIKPNPNYWSVEGFLYLGSPNEQTCFVERDGTVRFKSENGAWSKPLKLPWGWETRMWFAQWFLERHHYAIRSAKAKEKAARDYAASMANDNHRLETFRPKLTAEKEANPCSNTLLTYTGHTKKSARPSLTKRT